MKTKTFTVLMGLGLGVSAIFTTVSVINLNKIPDSKSKNYDKTKHKKRSLRWSAIFFISCVCIMVFALFLLKRIDGFDSSWEKRLDVSVNEMTKNIVPGAIEVEHRKNLVDWSQAIDENGQCSTREDPMMIVRQKKTIRPVGDFEKRLIANQRHSGKDGRSDQRN